MIIFFGYQLVQNEGEMARIRPNNRSFVRNDASRRNLTAVNGFGVGLWASNQGRLKESIPARTGDGTGLVLLQLMCTLLRTTICR